jgi:hypothetical protein
MADWAGHAAGRGWGGPFRYSCLRIRHPIAHIAAAEWIKFLLPVKNNWATFSGLRMFSIAGIALIALSIILNMWE